MTKITVLGSGTAVSSFYKPFDFRAPPGYLLEHDGKQYLIECSDGMRGRLEKIKIDYFSIDSIFISHFHPDHFSILPFIQSIYVRTRWANQKKEINIYGPKGMENKLRTFWEMTHFKGSYDERIVPFLKINFFEFGNKKKFILEKNLSITSFSVHHESRRMDAYAMRFQIGQKVFTYSGDCGPCQGVNEAAEGADLLISECSADIGVDHSEYGHFNSYQVGAMAAKRNVKTLVLSHLTNKYSPSELVADVLESGFTGVVKAAEDRDVLQLENA